MYCTSELFADGEKFLSEKDLPSCQNSSQLSSLWPMDRKLEITLRLARTIAGPKVITLTLHLTKCDLIFENMRKLIIP
jgi:hypothetical protein